MSQLPSPVPTHLIIVCCHSIYIGPDSLDESSWLIEPFQTGETDTYIRHIEAGVGELAKDEAAILVFSGGATKRERTARGEGGGYLVSHGESLLSGCAGTNEPLGNEEDLPLRSYLTKHLLQQVAMEHNLFGLETTPSMLRQRMFVERFATDSYQNILLSLIQFPQFLREMDTNSDSRYIGQSAPLPDKNHFHFPTKITIVSHEFKRSRFLDLHLPAMHWTKETEYIGINPPFDSLKMAEIETGDRLRGYGAWEKDMYGAGELLAKKRKARGWDGEEFRREVLDRFPVDEVRKEVDDLVFWKDGDDLTRLWNGKLPWV